MLCGSRTEWGESVFGSRPSGVYSVASREYAASSPRSSRLCRCARMNVDMLNCHVLLARAAELTRMG
jgi:hypothetical protein